VTHYFSARHKHNGFLMMCTNLFVTRQETNQAYRTLITDGISYQ
jgi:hypothetical protein